MTRCLAFLFPLALCACASLPDRGASADPPGESVVLSEYGCGRGGGRLGRVAMEVVR